MQPFHVFQQLIQNIIYIWGANALKINFYKRTIAITSLINIIYDYKPILVYFPA